MFGECHAHMYLNGVDYHQAVHTHQPFPDEAVVREQLLEYQKRGICFIRDGGDAKGVSQLAARLAPEYGIAYATPIFAIHKEGHYGKVVGRSFRDFLEYRQLIEEVRRQKGDFVKIMISGIMDFAVPGKLTEDPLSSEEIREMIHIAHEEGFSVMIHGNGDRAAAAAIEAGADSLEHGNYLSKETLCMLAESDCIWIPTEVTIFNLAGSGRFPEDSVRKITQLADEAIQTGWQLGAKIGLGSDAGAYRVLHGQGLQDEYQHFRQLGLEHLDDRLSNVQKKVQERFFRDSLVFFPDSQYNSSNGI